MQSLEQFIAEQQKALEEKKKEIAAFEALGEIPGLVPYLIHGVLYDIRHIAFKLADFGVFMEWARNNCDDVYAIEGRYRIFYPHVPKTRDYEGDPQCGIVATGNVRVEYSTIMRRFVANVFCRGYRISFELPHKHVPELMPRAQFKTGYSDNYHGERRVETWSKPGGGIRQYLRISCDRQSADLETLMYWGDFEAAFRPAEKE